MSRRQLEAAIVIGAVLLVLVIFAPAVQNARHASRRSQSKNNLKQLGLALHNYHDTYTCLPPGGTFHGDGRPHHGWMASVLPFVDASPMYNWIDFNRPWDSAANAGIFLEPHVAYQSPFVQMTVGSWEYYPAHYSANAHLLGPNSSVRLGSIPTKASMMLVGELNSEFVPWGCPFNYRPLKSLNHQDAYGGLDRKVWNVLLADGNVTEVSEKIAPELLRSLSGPSLAFTDKAPKTIQRPNHFTVPAGALKQHFYAGGNGKWRLDFIDKNGRVARSEEGEGKF
jgi:hypothetical protein